MVCDLSLRLSNVLVDLLGSTLNPKPSLLEHSDLFHPHIHSGEQLPIRLLKVLLGPLSQPSQGFSPLLQLLDISKVKLQAFVMLELDKHVTLLIGELRYHPPDLRLLVDELTNGKGKKFTWLKVQKISKGDTGKDQE